jgi:DNA-binding MarR family transcriptional regulator
VSRWKETALVATSKKLHSYFCSVAEARFIMRRVVRIVDERAKEHGLDPLQHQALIQIFGAREHILIRDVAQRLDIPPTFASKLIKALINAQYVTAHARPGDARASLLRATAGGERLLAKIDSEVRVHMTGFTRELNSDQKAAALGIFANHVGVKVAITGIKRGTGVSIPSARSLKV